MSAVLVTYPLCLIWPSTCHVFSVLFIKRKKWKTGHVLTHLRAQNVLASERQGSQEDTGPYIVYVGKYCHDHTILMAYGLWLQYILSSQIYKEILSIIFQFYVTRKGRASSDRSKLLKETDASPVYHSGVKLSKSRSSCHLHPSISLSIVDSELSVLFFIGQQSVLENTVPLVIKDGDKPNISRRVMGPWFISLQLVTASPVKLHCWDPHIKHNHVCPCLIASQDHLENYKKYI